MVNGGGDGRMDGRTDGWMEGRTDGRTDGRLEIPSCVLQDFVPFGAAAQKQLSRPQFCFPDLKSAFQASNLPLRPQIGPSDLRPVPRPQF